MSPDNDFAACSSALICRFRKEGLEALEYEVDKSKSDYYNNWYVSLDLMCQEVLSYSSVNSFLFIGYGVGAVCFFLPDIVGRRGTMKIMIPTQIVAIYFAIYNPSILIKKISFFAMGFFHLKNNLTYMHGLELVAEKNKVTMTTIINAFDTTSLLTICCYLKFYNPDMTAILNIHYIVGFVFCLLYFIVIPESPKYLFLKYGSNS